MVKVYHDPGCSKSNAALDFLVSQGIPFNLISYREEGLSPEELDKLLELLDLPASELVRSTDVLYRDLFGDNILNEEQNREILLKYPALMQRPVVVFGDRAVIARPVEKIREILP